MSYPTQLDCQLLQTWEEQLPHLTLLSWNYQLLMHDLLRLHLNCIPETNSCYSVICSN
jgi:hypothetical protein